jgi:hypothetical protein
MREMSWKIEADSVVCITIELDATATKANAVEQSLDVAIVAAGQQAYVRRQMSPVSTSLNMCIA